MGSTQFGVKNSFSRREVLFSMQVLTQQFLDINVDVYACFIDYEKAFNRGRHDKLI